MSQNLIEGLRVELEAERGAVLVSVIAFRGSVPRKDYPKALFLDDGRQVGTVGGGCVDGFARQLAMKALAEGKTLRDAQVLDGEDAESSGLICGGRLEMEAEPFAPGAAANERLSELLADPGIAAPLLLIFGGGHVGLASARFADAVGFRVAVHDDRESFVSEERFPFAILRLVGDIAAAGELPDLTPADAILISTRGHSHDYAALAWACRSEAGYVGLLGSRRKRRLLLERLAENGLSAELLERRLRSPVGLKIGALSAEEIALAAAAELVAFRRGAL
jgi:xanthine dehydrogenase accessory factor